MKRLIISAPFGNYLNFEHATSTLGTFTLRRRGGWPYRLWRVARTLRYHRRMKSWTNKLGLPNPGLLACPENPGRRIVSIHGFDTLEWVSLIGMCNRLWVPTDEHETFDQPEAIELNVSCPNVADDPIDYNLVFQAAYTFLKNRFLPVIVKLPPVNYLKIANVASANDLRQFHCCNTLPTPAGGLSGKALKAVSLNVIEHLKTSCPGSIIYGGGGVSTRQDIDDYHNAGASFFCVGSALLNPFNHRRIRKLAKEVDDLEIMPPKPVLPPPPTCS